MITNNKMQKYPIEISEITADQLKFQLKELERTVRLEIKDMANRINESNKEKLRLEKRLRSVESRNMLKKIYNAFGKLPEGDGRFIYISVFKELLSDTNNAMIQLDALPTGDWYYEEKDTKDISLEMYLIDCGAWYSISFDGFTDWQFVADKTDGDDVIVNKAIDIINKKIQQETKNKEPMLKEGMSLEEFIEKNDIVLKDCVREE